MGSRRNKTQIKQWLKNRNLGNKCAQIANLSGYISEKKTVTLSISKYLWAFALCFFCFASSGYAMDVMLKWAPNTEANLAGYNVYCRQEGKPYQYTQPYWETTDATCTIYDLDKTKTYYFVVRAFDTQGHESINSNEVCLKANEMPGN